MASFIMLPLALEAAMMSSFIYEWVVLASHWRLS
jgi:hypothetical protein